MISAIGPVTAHPNPFRLMALALMGGKNKDVVLTRHVDPYMVWAMPVKEGVEPYFLFERFGKAIAIHLPYCEDYEDDDVEGPLEALYEYFGYLQLMQGGTLYIVMLSPAEHALSVVSASIEDAEVDIADELPFLLIEPASDVINGLIGRRIIAETATDARKRLQPGERLYAYRKGSKSVIYLASVDDEHVPRGIGLVDFDFYAVDANHHREAVGKMSRVLESAA